MSNRSELRLDNCVGEKGCARSSSAIATKYNSCFTLSSLNTRIVQTDQCHEQCQCQDQIGVEIGVHILIGFLPILRQGGESGHTADQGKKEI